MHESLVVAILLVFLLSLFPNIETRILLDSDPASNSHIESSAYSDCKQKYGKIQYIPQKQMFDRKVPLLLSFPGSGNTWVRLLMEYSTGYFSGSIDVNDAELRQLFTGEAACGLRTCIVKGHPSDMILKEEKSQTGKHIINIRFVYKNHKKKCQRGSIHFWERVVLLVRNPYKAIFAEFQRHISGSHTGSAPASYFNASVNNHTIWLENALKGAEDYDAGMEHLVYPILLGSQRESLLLGFKNPVSNISSIISPHYYSITPSRQLPKVEVAILRFENLLDKSKRVSELQQILNFMNFTVSNERVECAFILAERPSVHRPQRLNISFAYNYIRPSLPYDMWKYLESFSKIFSYPHWDNYTS